MIYVCDLNTCRYKIKGACSRPDITNCPHYRLKEQMTNDWNWIYDRIYEECRYSHSNIPFDRIEEALGFRLFIWQKTYIARGQFHSYGRTTAEILRELFDFNKRDEPIDFSKPPHDYHETVYRQHFYHIWKKLIDAGLENDMRSVIW